MLDAVESIITTIHKDSDACGDIGALNPIGIEAPNIECLHARILDVKEISGNLHHNFAPTVVLNRVLMIILALEDAFVVEPPAFLETPVSDPTIPQSFKHGRLHPRSGGVRKLLQAFVDEA